jgi:hypothetical protein
MRNYYGVYKGKQGWASREAAYANDEVALSGMRTLALKKVVTNDEGKTEEKMFFYDLDYLLCGNRVIFNG